MEDNQKNRDEAIAGFRAVLEACAGLSPEQQLTVPLIAWLTIADSARDGAVSLPGGYEAERARQLGYLEKVARIVRSARSDLDVQRLRRVDDWTGALNHIKALIGTARTGGTPAAPKRD